MNYSKYRISLNIHDTNSQAMLNIKKADTARKVYFSLTDGGRPYQIAEGCTAVFRAKKPDGTILYNDCTISDNVIEYTLTQQTSASVGIVDCEVTLYGSDSRQITSPRFVFVVEDNLYSDSEIESTDEFTALTSAIAKAGNINASVSKTGNKSTITITDKEGTDHTAEVIDGADGSDGVGISNIVKTSTSGNVDTYTITLTDDTTKTFTVTNGNDGINGIDGQDGTDGISVTDASIDNTGHLIITLSNGTSIDAGMAKGDIGDIGLYIGDTAPTDPSIKVWIDTSGKAGDVEMTSNKATSISSSATDTQYPSAKAVYDIKSELNESISEANLLATTAVGLANSKGTWSTIADTTISESVAQYTITTSGNYKKLLIRIEMTEDTSEATGMGRVQLGFTGTANQTVWSDGNAWIGKTKLPNSSVIYNGTSNPKVIIFDIDVAANYTMIRVRGEWNRATIGAMGQYPTPIHNLQGQGFGYNDWGISSVVLNSGVTTNKITLYFPAEAYPLFDK